MKAELARNALMSEIMAKRFDENSAGSGIVRCNESEDHVDSAQISTHNPVV